MSIPVFLEVNHAVVDKLVIEVLSSQVSVTIGSLDFENTFLDSKEGNIESTTSKIENENVSLLSLLTIKTVSDCSSSWLIDDSENIDAGNSSCILGGLSLSIIEVSWNSDDSRFD